MGARQSKQKYQPRPQPGSNPSMSELKENADMSELEVAIRRKVKSAEKFCATDDDDDDEYWYRRLVMVHLSPYTFVSRTSI